MSSFADQLKGTTDAFIEALKAQSEEGRASGVEAAMISMKDEHASQLQSVSFGSCFPEFRGAVTTALYLARVAQLRVGQVCESPNPFSGFATEIRMCARDFCRIQK